MVERIEAKGLDSFDGKIVDVELKEGEFGEQYIMKIEPFDKSLIKKGKTGAFWNYIRVSDSSDDKHVAIGSVLDQFCVAVGRIDGEMKKVYEKETVPEFFNKLKGKSYTFNAEKLGKAFEGHEARKTWLPVKKL
jgi:uncharacterized membrane protein YkoI